ncbi:MAG: hypothetical protein KAH10_02225 [Flavobacteriales bacterium]|nr:hypothetical protein [Flavobacteriales bacterium]
MRKIISIALVLFSINAFAQPGQSSANSYSKSNSSPSRHLNFERFLIAGDASSALISDYLGPAIRGIMVSSSSSWYSTAETHERFGFNISVSGTGALVPSSDENFTVTPSNQFTTNSPNNQLATIFGEIAVMPDMTGTVYRNGTYYTRTMEAPTGAGLGTNLTPNIMLQAGMGIGWGTEIKARFVPKLGNDTFRAGSWGVALQHDIFQYIPFEGKVPVYVSVLAAYTSSYGEWVFANEDDYAWDGEDQKTSFDAQSWSFQLMASTNLPVINFYGGVGYNTSEGGYNMKGTYEVVYTDVNNSTNKLTETYENPANGDYTYGGFNATIGTKLTLGVFNIYGDYSFKEFNVVNLGLEFYF